MTELMENIGTNIKIPKEKGTNINITNINIPKEQT